MKRFLLILPLVFLLNVLAAKDNLAPYSLIEKNDRIGLADIHGNIIIPPDYENLGWTGGSLKVIRDRIGYCEKGLWGILDLENKKITPPHYLSLNPCENDQLIASIPDQFKLAEIFGIINIEGKPVSDFLYNILTEAGEYFIVGVRKAEVVRYGVIGSSGQITIPINYEMINFLGYNLFSCTNATNGFVLMNGEGNVLSGELFEEILPFKSGYADIAVRGKHGLIDKTGRIILKPEYKDIEVRDAGSIKSRRFNEWNIFEGSECLSKLYYDSLISFSADRLVAMAGGILKIINLKDSCLASLAGIQVIQVSDDAMVVRGKHKQGLLGVNGAIIYPVIYDSIIFVNDYVLMNIKKDSETGWMMGNRTGEILNYGLYDNMVPLNRGNIMAKRNGYWGLLNNHGEEKINCIYDTINYNENGLIKVVFHRENGLLWKNRWFIYPGTEQIEIMKDGQVLISGYNGSLIINVLGDTLYKSDDIIIPEGNFFKVISNNGKYGLLDQGFNTILYPVIDHMMYYKKDSMFVFKSENGWGAVNSRGIILFNNLPGIDTIFSFADGYFRVLIDHNYGFIDTNGKLRIANRYTDARDFVDGLAPVEILDRWGFISKYEVFLIQPFYDEVVARHNGFIIIRRDSDFGIINNKGESVLDQGYQSISLQQSGGFLCRKNGLIGYINEQGLLTVIPRYDRIDVLANGNLIVSRNNKFGMISGMGETILPVIYDGLYEDLVSHHIIAMIRSDWKTL